jgi:tryptophan synthase beta subunit
LLRNGSTIPGDTIVVANLSGRGDKDVPQIAAMEGHR